MKERFNIAPLLYGTMGGHLCSQMGRNGQESGKGGAKEDKGTGTGKKKKNDGKWPLGHPFRERVPKYHFQGLPAHSPQP